MAFFVWIYYTQRMKQLFSKIFSRVTLVGFFIVIQILALSAAIILFGNYFAYFYGFCLLLSAAIVIHIVNGNSNPSYKIAWIIPIMALPVFGSLLYLVFGKNRLSRREQAKMRSLTEKFRAAMSTDSSATGLLKAEHPEAALMSNYIRHASATPVFNHTETAYLPVGEVYFSVLTEELKKARKFIFLEYYIIQSGRMWDEIHAILVEKAQQGLDVRVMYDDFGCMFKLPDGYDKILEAEGVHACIFNRFLPILSSRFNNRDHRKIAVIDGNVGFTGGINFADRYINAGGYEGHWLDSGVLLRGEAVWALTAMFLSIWDFVTQQDDLFSKYAPDPAFLKTVSNDGFVQPFTDTPLDSESTGETVYMNIINRAQKYVYINTPYLIIDNEMITALTTAAKCGVDIRLVTPAKSDSKLVQEMTRSYYQQLMEAGVKIYEYTPGMVHAKTFVSDDRFGVVGTINLDYRSLFLHFECAAWMYATSAVTTMKDSFLEELTVCIPVTPEMCREQSRFQLIKRGILRVLAPLF